MFIANTLVVATLFTRKNKCAIYNMDRNLLDTLTVVQLSPNYLRSRLSVKLS